MPSQYLIGIDVGTTGAKAVLIDGDGKTIMSAFAEYPLALPLPGWAEQNPEDWVQATVQTIRTLLEQSAVQADAIAGLALSGQMHGLVCLDAAGIVLRPAILWCDTRTTAQCRDIEKQLGGSSEVIRHTFNSALEGFTLPKLLWVREHEPEIYQQIQTILLPKDYVRFRLTGHLGMDLSDAAGTLLLDVGNQRWSQVMADAFGINVAILPPLGQSTDIAGAIAVQMAADTGLRHGTPVAFGGADNACAAVGTGVVREGMIAVSIGSSGTVIAPVSHPVHDADGRAHTFLHSVPQMWYVMGVMQAAGLSMKWLRDNFGGLEKDVAENTGQDVYEVLTAGAATISPGADGLLWLPYLNGERTPHMDPNARGVLFGISPRHTKDQVVRAVMEGVVFGLKDSMTIINGLGIDAEEVRLTGGGGRSLLWRQILADVFQKPVATVNIEEGPAFGAAIIAGVATGVFSDFQSITDKIVHVVERTQPNTETYAVYKKAWLRYGRLYQAVREEFISGD